MANDDELDFSELDGRKLSPQQWSALRRNVIRRAERLRHESNRAMARKLAALVVNGADRILCVLSPALAWLKTATDQRTGSAQLQRLDDRALKDIGMDRSEIESVVRAHGNDTTRVRHNTHQPDGCYSSAPSVSR